VKPMAPNVCHCNHSRRCRFSTPDYFLYRHWPPPG